MSDMTATLLPFVGPRPFETSDRDLFFGRDREAHEIRSLLLANKLFILYGASGAGKTSLVNAGVLPLIEDELDILPTARFQSREPRSGQSVANVYTTAVLAGWADAGELGRLARTTLAEFLAGRPRRLAEPIDLPVPRLLVFDQFEELFTTHADLWPQRRQFLEQLAEASDADPELRVLIVMREDFLARLLSFADTFLGGLKDRYFLEPLRKPEAEMAISGPVLGVRRTFEPGVIENLVQRLMTTRVDIGDERIVYIEGEFVEPILLQVVCQTMWAALPAEVTTITLAYVRDFADVDEALGRFYSDGVREAARRGGITEQQVRAWVGQKLVTPGGTRSTVYAGAKFTEGLPNEAVAALEGKLLRAEFRAGARWLEITHDSLLAPIERSNAAFFSPIENLGLLVDRLAESVTRQWTHGIAVRQFNDYSQLSVSWAAADPSLTVSWRDLVSLAEYGSGRSSPPPAGTWSDGPDGLAGLGDQLPDVLKRVPTGWLTVLGEPGSGKTMLMIQLTLELLARRRSGQPVPVLVPITSWDPVVDDLHSWLEDMLTIDHPGLASHSPVTDSGKSHAGGLLASRMIVPILDGRRSAGSTRRLPIPRARCSCWSLVVPRSTRRQ
jgi:hypothetical protein